MELAADPTKPQIKPAVTIAEAVSSFRADEDGRCLEKTTIAQEGLCMKCSSSTGPSRFGPAHRTDHARADEVQGLLGQRANTTRRKHERLVGFFNFCIANDWIEKNPAARMKRVEEKRVPTDYFTRQESERIVDATYAYGDWQGGHDFHSRQRRLLALVLLMRWSGLAIKDAVTLERERLGSDGRLFLWQSRNRPVVP